MKTVLVTGASSGIGLEFARVFAANNHNLVLVARSEDKLEALRKELTASFSVEVTVIVADLREMGQVKMIFDACKEKNIIIDYLINNAGLGDFSNFENEQWEIIEKMIDVNVKSLTYLCNLFIPDMINRKSGRILNVASTAAFQPGPGMAVYFATKSYVLFLSEALHNELAGFGVTVTCLCPGPTESGFKSVAAMENHNLFREKKIPTSKEVAEFGYKAMMKGEMTVIHGLLNNIMVFASRFAPRKAVVSIAKMVNGAPNS